jgi:hypothetical protein
MARNFIRANVAIDIFETDIIPLRVDAEADTAEGAPPGTSLHSQEPVAPGIAIILAAPPSDIPGRAFPLNAAE